MMTHSPRPWSLLIASNGSPLAVFDANDELICNLSSPQDGDLMAASPDLLEACELARSQLSCDCGFPCCNTCDTIRQLDAAIQKARGE